MSAAGLPDEIIGLAVGLVVVAFLLGATVAAMVAVSSRRRRHD